jgi:translation initiation factor 2 alpha subunit (eIF-2alpha)
MEAFIKIVEEKKESVDDVNLHTQIIERLKSLLSYKISPQSFDVMNHLCLMSKLKPRDVSYVKKKLKDAGT